MRELLASVPFVAKCWPHGQEQKKINNGVKQPVTLAGSHTVTKQGKQQLWVVKHLLYIHVEYICT